MGRTRGQYLSLHLMAALRKLRCRLDKQRLFVGTLAEFRRNIKRPSLKLRHGKIKQT